MTCCIIRFGWAGFVRLQSAMEYLMTYGWAILIIAVVLAALFELGVFNVLSLEPHVAPGACYVYRPEGPSTLAYISLSGECNGYLPQFVASFNGYSTNISAPISALSLMNKGQFAVTSWIYVKGQTGTEQIPVSLGADVCYTSYSSGPNDTGVILIAAPGYPASAPSNAQPDYFKAAACIFNTTYGGAQWEWVTADFTQGDYNKWIFVATTYNGTYLDLYINGNLVNSTKAPGTLLPPKGYISLGNMYSPIYSGSRFWYNGSLSNIQVYNESISAQGVKYLYDKGIGEPPEELDKLALWIPLNGNANDYSGNTYGSQFYNGSYYGWINNYRYT